MNEEMDYDVAIIGSGIAGSALGAILARHGQRVIIFEAKTHPRFAIGESLILETSEMMRALAHFFDVPELAYFSSENFLAYAGTTHGVKRHFGFLHHQPGREHDPRRTLQAIIPREPHGHELHLYRQDTDYFLMSTAVSYGAAIRQNQPVADIRPDAAGVTVLPVDGAPVHVRYVVDAGGFRSLLAEKFQLRDFDLQTHSRGMFTHMINVPGFTPPAVEKEQYQLPFRMAEGTLHHVFPGGWLWIIPFNNHPDATNPLCSVGLLLDPRQYPERRDLSAEEEFFAIIEQFPTIAAQLKTGQAVRAWVRAGRLQYSSRQVVGDRWALLGHAAGFIDPLYSKGLYSSLAAVFLLAHRLLAAAESGDYSAAAFRDVEQVTQAFVCSADQLIAGSYRSFNHPDLWPRYAVLWLLGAYTELVKLNMMRAQHAADREAYYRELTTLKLCGGGFDGYDGVAAQVDALLMGLDVQDEGGVQSAVAAMDRIFHGLDWIADPFLALLDGKRYLPKNKLRLSLLKPGEGFMRSGAYRRHFFGDLTLADLLLYGVREKVRYARPLLNWRHTRQGGV